MSEPFDEGFIVRYLLGDLSEQEQIEVEDRAFSDAQVMQNILAVEADLIDEYVRGGLDQSERRQFESRFLASTERRQKVEFARALSKVAHESVLTETVHRPIATMTRAPWWSSLMASLRGSGPAFRLSLAAASLVVVVGISWLVVETIKVRGELTQLHADQRARQHEQQALEQQFADERALNQDLAARLQREQQQREHSEELIREFEREKEETATKPTQPTFLSFVLLPGISRSGSAVPKLAIPQAARLVRLQVGIEPGDEYKSFRVEVRSQAGQPIWTQENLSARAGRGGQAVGLNLPARLLSSGQYELALKGVTDKGNTEAVGYYYFEVLKK